MLVVITRPILRTYYFVLPVRVDKVVFCVVLCAGFYVAGGKLRKEKKRGGGSVRILGHTVTTNFILSS